MSVIVGNGRPGAAFGGLSAAEYNDWRTQAELFRKVERPLVEGLLKEMPFARALDIGCGTGLWTCRLAELQPQAEVVGIDPSQPMIDFARRRCGARVNFLTFDASAYSNSRGFDLIISALSADYIGFEVFAETTRRNISPGGIVLAWFLDPRRYPLQEGRRLKVWQYCDQQIRADIEDFSLEEVRSQMRHTGFDCRDLGVQFDLSDGIARKLHCVECRSLARSVRSIKTD